MKKLTVVFIILSVVLIMLNIKTTQSIAESNYVAKIYIDNPADGQVTTVNQKIDIIGWYMSNDEQAYIKVYIDDKEQSTSKIIREPREDVINAIQGYGSREENPNPGFLTTVDITGIEDGIHTLKIDVFSRNGEKLAADNRTILVTKYNAKAYIENPTNLQITKQSELNISGWLMSDDEQAQIEIYVDNEKQEIQNLVRMPRQDVINAIKGYGDAEQNPSPGLKATIDLADISEGIHNLKLVIVSREGNVLTTVSREINVENYKAKSYIETPAEGTIQLVEDILTIDGWLMTDDEQAQIKIFADGQKIEILQNNRIERQDVINAIQGYGSIENNPKPGFSLKVDLSNLEHGLHDITLNVVSRNGKTISSLTRTIQLKKYVAKAYLDTPKSNAIVKPIMGISGWIMSNDEQAQINVYIDKEKQDLQSFTRTERPDVLASINGYGDSEQNLLPGYEATLNLFQVTEGLHTLRVEVISRKGDVLTTVSKIINVEKYKARIYIDYLSNGNEIKGKDILTIGGWLMSEDEQTKIRLFVDDEEKENIQFTRTERPDVLNAIQGYGTSEQNPLPGYNAQVDLSGLLDGKHTVRVEAISRTGDVISTATRDIEVNKYRADANIERPIIMGQIKSELIVSGWLMTTDKESTVNIYINDQIQYVSELKRTERPDVINAIKGYGGIEENPLPGYEAQIDVSQFSDGKYTLKIEVVSREGEVIYIGTRQFVIYNTYDLGIDVSNHNGQIDWGKVREQGIKFAIIRAAYRGYGTEGNLREDTEFVANMKGAIANGIDIGVYFYSQAINEKEAIQEAEMTLQLIQNNGFSNDITLPIVIDTEKSGGRGDQMTREQRTAVVKAFCNRIIQAGYKPMIYSNKDWLINQLNMNELAEYDVWLAHHTNTDDPANNPSNYKGNYQIWQYTSTGSVYGISGNVDRNIAYKKYVK